MVINLKHTNIILDLDNLRDNINYYFNNFNKKILAVVKNNAYGHGLKEIASYLEKDDRIIYLVVNSISEGIYLRRNNITKNILVLGNPEIIDYKIALKNNLTLSINNVKSFYNFLDNNYKGKLHLNINTGMNRLGISNFDITKILKSSLNIEGIYTHYKGGDSDLYSIKKQKEIFNNYINSIDYKKYIIHDVSTNNVSLLDLKYTNAIRIGLGLYGLTYNTKPILTLKAPIINIIKVSKNESVSYHSSFIAPSDGYILTIPFGYGEGWYKNIEIINKNYIQAGEMTMNYTMFFSKDYPKEKEIEILGSTNKMINISLINKISPYEIVTKLSPFINRYIINQK